MLELEKELINNIADCAYVWWEAADVVWRATFTSALVTPLAAWDAMKAAEIALDKAIEVYNEHIGVNI